MIKRIFILLIISSSCIESYQPDIPFDGSFVVITGNITDISPAVIRIERSISANSGNTSTSSQTNTKIPGATVTIYGSDGSQEILNDVGDGLYKGTILGVSGISYYIDVDLPNNRNVVSTPEILKPNAEVGDLFIERSTQNEFIDGYSYLINGLDFNVYLNEENTLSKYYKWTLSGTYEFHSPNPTGPPCFIMDVYSGNFSIGESISNNKDIISQRLIFLESNGRKFSKGYSMEVTQYSLTQEAYNYWKKVDDQQNNVGSVFDSPPAQILGNLSYVNYQDAPVLGFFEANSVKKKRLFIKPSDFISEPILETAACEPRNPTSIPPAWCSDCLAFPNSTNTKPSYWPN